MSLITFTSCFWFQLTADVLGCNIYSDGSAAAIDTWNPSGSKTNVLDKDEVCLEFCSHTIQRQNYSIFIP